MASLPTLVKIVVLWRSETPVRLLSRAMPGMIMLLIAASSCTLPVDASADDRSPITVSVGMPQLIEQILLPGSELEAKPLDRDSPLVVRIIETFPHGTDHRYDLEVYGLDPGEYNVADYLQRIDGSSVENLPAIPLTVETILPPGQITPHDLAGRQLPSLGGYTLLLLLGVIVWPLGLIAILYWIALGFFRTADEADVDQRVPVAERLKPLIEQAMKGELDQPKQARLERMLVMFWRDRLDLQHANAAEAVAILRNHDEAGELLRQLEAWLHQPPNRRRDVDIAELLKPYQNPPSQPAEAIKGE